MRSLLVVLLSLSFILPSCKKDKKVSYRYTATITGPDLTMTVCSGGYFISIDGAPGAIRFETLPAGSNIDLTTAAFPLRVKLNWHSDGDPPGPCGIIQIDAIAKAD